jgi:hypothetical protein
MGQRPTQRKVVLRKTFTENNLILVYPNLIFFFDKAVFKRKV